MSAITIGAGAVPSPGTDAGDSSAPRQSSMPEPGRRDESSWSVLVDRIRGGDDSAMEDLYAIFSRGVRFYLCRQLGLEELDDKVHDTFLIVLQAIRRGELRDPDRLLGFIRTVVRRQVAAYIDQAIQIRKDQTDLELGVSIADAGQNPEDSAIWDQKVKLMEQILLEVSPRDREILIRFYVHEQTQEQICAELNLTETQFRLMKSRAKARFGEAGRRRLSKKPLGRFFMRKSAGA